MRVGEGFGQLRMTGDVCDEYSMTSMRPYPYRSEEDLIERKEVENLNPVWSDDAYAMGAWPGYVKAPPNPSLEREVYPIRRGMSRLRWNKAGPWNLNYKPGEGSLMGYASYPEWLENMLKTGPSITEHVIWLALSTAGVFSAIAAYRAMDREPSTAWKAALGAGIAVSALLPLGYLGILAAVIAKKQGS